ncbi:threonine/serine exporter family protein [uncultured Clostridium sp.]|uniref:threonine/serine exporter family protein n=1 Tax=uncultured Clostridium sp. TaxID=59620 RepID=UPI0025F6D311|nr:threonine/serine exporter family protein [uncultured Clostridium sp.]
MISTTLAAALGALGFAVIFNIKGKKLFYAFLGGGLSWLVYEICLSLNISSIVGFFISSVCCSIYSEIFARVLKTPVTTLIVCCLIQLVPGAGMYNTMFEIVNGNIDVGLSLAISTISSAGILALGIIFVSTITRYLRIKIKPRNNK